jgi:hypothetical protein
MEDHPSTLRSDDSCYVPDNFAVVGFCDTKSLVWTWRRIDETKRPTEPDDAVAVRQYRDPQHQRPCPGLEYLVCSPPPPPPPQPP